jgi:hypothetical protein
MRTKKEGRLDKYPIVMLYYAYPLGSELALQYPIKEKAGGGLPEIGMRLRNAGEHAANPARPRP